MKPLYKVGDKVAIKSKYDPGCKSGDYRFSFVQKMLDTLGGKICTISEIAETNLGLIDRILDDRCKYRIKEDRGSWSWASSMFDPEF